MQATKKDRKAMMLEEKVSTLIPKMAIPTIIAQLITTIYNLADTYFVSTLGTFATAAVGVNSSLERCITLVGTLIGAGACSYISRLLGAKRDEEAHRVLSTSFFTALGIGLVMAIVGRICIGPIVYALGATEECVEYSIQYATYVLYAAPFMIGSFTLNMCLRSEGSAMLAMVGIGFGGVLNCFLDPLFIYGLDLGVAGASMATAISKFISFCILIFPYIRHRSNVNISIKRFKYVFDDVKNVLSIGSTSFFRSAMSIVSNVILNHVAGAISTSAMAALSVANRVMELPFALILGFGMGYQPVAGFNWGAKQWKRVRDSLKFCTWVSIIGSIIVGGLIFVFAVPIVHLFNKQADAEVLTVGVLCIRLQCAAMSAHSLGSIINMFYAGIGKAKAALLMSTARQGYLFIPVVLLLPVLMGINGVASAQAVADILSFAISIPLGVKAFRLTVDADTDIAQTE